MSNRKVTEIYFTCSSHLISTAQITFEISFYNISAQFKQTFVWQTQVKEYHDTILIWRGTFDVCINGSSPPTCLQVNTDVTLQVISPHLTYIWTQSHVFRKSLISFCVLFKIDRQICDLARQVSGTSNCNSWKVQKKAHIHKHKRIMYAWNYDISCTLQFVI
jgi:hypothetical protein